MRESEFRFLVLAVAAFWEFLEWWVALPVASDVGAAFLGSQGDIWDAQWDMALALVDAMVALPILSRLHDRSMAQLSKAQSTINRFTTSNETI